MRRACLSSWLAVSMLLLALWAVPATAQTGDDTGILVLSFVASLTGVLSILVLPSTSCCLIPHWEEQLPPEARSAEFRHTNLTQTA